MILIAQNILENAKQSDYDNFVINTEYSGSKYSSTLVLIDNSLISNVTKWLPIPKIILL